VVAVDASVPALRRRLERVARDLGARPRTVADRDRVLYHAAAVFASNFGVTLLAVATRLLEEIGWSERDAVEGLLPLMTGALEQAREGGPSAALTGPIRRGDVTVVQRHLDALDRLKRRPGRVPASELYRMLATIALEIALDAGLEPAAAERVTRALTRKVAATRRRRRQ
jgi:predicted short-subunit dehydrogenase-like oxidoreductase (DUF2520 family)